MKILRAIGVFISTALIYLGIPLAGWGILKIGSFFSTFPYSCNALLVFAFSLLYNTWIEPISCIKKYEAPNPHNPS
jgi:hypothetical protein